MPRKLCGLVLSGVILAGLTMPVMPILSTPAAAQISAPIDRIDVIGTQRIDPETVKSYLLVAVGDAFNPEKLDRSLKTLFDTGLFADVVLSREANALVISVVENPIINRISFEGNQRLKDADLQSEVQLRPRLVFTRARARQDVDRLLAIYRGGGRFAVSIEPKVVQLPQNRVDLIFEINEGPLSRIDAVTFVGNKRFSDNDLRDVVSTKEYAWWAFFETGDSYDPDRLSFDRELLRRHYLKHGYADFRVISAVAELAPDREDFLITFTINEGKRYNIGEVSVTSKIQRVDTTEIAPLLTTKSGNRYNNIDVDDSILAVTDHLGSLGFAFINIQPMIRRHPEDGILDVTYQIGEGQKTYVERIVVRGNVRTLDEVIRREMQLVEGDAFNTAKIRRSRKRIRNLGYFRSVKVTTNDGSQPDKAQIVVDVEEQSTGKLSFGFGLSSAENVLGDISLRERNFLGRGQDLRISLKASSTGSQFDIGFTEPYFLGREFSAGFDLFSETRVEEDASSFDEERQGFTLRTGYRLSPNLKQSVQYTLRNTDVTNVQSDASILVKAQEGQTLVSLLGQKLTYDKRDSRTSPTEGYYLSMSNQLAGLGGDLAYLRTRLRGSYYVPVVDDDWILRLSGLSGTIFGLNDDVPINERFFLGGSSFSGFERSGVGPRDRVTKDALGGNLFYVGTAELSFPIGFSEALGLRARIFSEVGSLWSIDNSNASVLDSESPRVSAGFGVSWGAALGGIRIDFSEAIVKEDEDETEFLRFSLGTRF